MEIFVLLAQGVLAIIFVYFGALKMFLPQEKIVKRVSWGNDYPARTLKLFGLLEFLGGLGIILPDLLGVYPILTPMAATGLALTMSGASIVHLKRDEFEMILVNLFLMFISAGIGFYRLLEM